MAIQRKQRERAEDFEQPSATQVAIDIMREQGVRQISKAAHDTSERNARHGTEPDAKPRLDELADKDVPLFDQSGERAGEADTGLNALDAGVTGYLVVFAEDNAVQAMVFDKTLQFVSDIDLNSEEAARLLEKAEEVTNLNDSIWDAIMGDLSPEQRMESKVFRLSEDVISERDAEIEEVMLDNDNEQPYGYDDEDD